MVLGKTAFGPFGWQSGPVDVEVSNRAGGTLSIGHLCEFNFDISGAETTSFAFGDTASAYSNVIDPTAAGVGTSGGRMLGIVIGADIADNADGKVRIYGKVDALVEDGGTSTTVAAGGLLATGAAAANVLDSDPAATTRCVGWAEVLVATTLTNTTGTLIPIFFNGVTFMGTP